MSWIIVSVSGAKASYYDPGCVSGIFLVPTAIEYIDKTQGVVLSGVKDIVLNNILGMVLNFLEPSLVKKM